MQPIEFLERFRPGGPWVLTAIGVDSRKMSTGTFRRVEDVENWLALHASDSNIYFSVNPTLRDVSKKAARTDIAALEWLHVDIDPRHDETPKEAKTRALSALQSGETVPRPNVIIDSGGGLQAFWRLKDALPIGGDLARAEDAKAYNLQLELLFGGDNCHNVDRIMRLPGTMNRPDARKRKKGRVDTPARCLEFHDGCVSIEAFTKAHAVQSSGDHFAGRQVEVSGNIGRLLDVDELDGHCGDGKTLEDWVKVVIVQGNRPDTEDPFLSRSEALFAVCCSLVRAGIDNDVIYSVITDPDFDISESVLDKGSGSERYALRQIARAQEEAHDPVLREFNDRFAVIGNYGGRCVVVEEEGDGPKGRTRFVPQSFTAFRDRHLNRKVQIGWKDKEQTVPATVAAGKWWLEHPDRRQYDKICFAPGKEVPGAYNMWRGFTVDAKPGDCSLFLTHLRENVCNNDEGSYNYLMGWLAHAVQRPELPGYSAVVLQGKQGTGKSFFVKWFGKLWGRHFLQIADPSHLVGRFNAHLEDCSILFADEAFWAGDKKHEGALKRLVTEETMAVERKGVDVETAPSRVHLIMASNEDWVVPAGADDRRFFVLRVGDRCAKDSAYFSAIDQQMREGGLSALLHELLSYDLSNFEVRKVPITEALMQQKTHTLNAAEEWWLERLQHGELCDGDGHWKGCVPKPLIAYDFKEYIQSYGLFREKGSSQALHRLFSRVARGWRQERVYDSCILPDRHGKDRRVGSFWMLHFPPLAELRATWEELYSGEWKWEAEGDRTKVHASDEETF